MPRNYRPIADNSKVLRIEMLTPPLHYEAGEGEYEVKWGDRPKEPEYHDLLSLEKLFKKIIPDRAEMLLDYLQNFRLVYLNMNTGEISSSTE